MDWHKVEVGSGRRRFIKADTNAVTCRPRVGQLVMDSFANVLRA